MLRECGVTEKKDEEGDGVAGWGNFRIRRIEIPGITGERRNRSESMRASPRAHLSLSPLFRPCRGTRIIREIRISRLNYNEPKLSRTRARVHVHARGDSRASSHTSNIRSICARYVST